jgi:hypothetical protein
VKRFKIFEVSLTWEEIKLSCIDLLGEIDGGKEEKNEWERQIMRLASMSVIKKATIEMSSHDSQG